MQGIVQIALAAGLQRQFPELGHRFFMMAEAHEGTRQTLLVDRIAGHGVQPPQRLDGPLGVVPLLGNLGQRMQVVQRQVGHVQIACKSASTRRAAEGGRVERDAVFEDGHRPRRSCPPSADMWRSPAWPSPERDASDTPQGALRQLLPIADVLRIGFHQRVKLGQGFFQHAVLEVGLRQVLAQFPIGPATTRGLLWKAAKARVKSLFSM